MLIARYPWSGVRDTDDRVGVDHCCRNHDRSSLAILQRVGDEIGQNGLDGSTVPTADHSWHDVDIDAGTVLLGLGGVKVSDGGNEFLERDRLSVQFENISTQASSIKQYGGSADVAFQNALGALDLQL